MLGLILLVLATSLDGFSAGVAYGFRRIKLPFWSGAAVAGLSALVLGVSMCLGASIGRSLPAGLLRYLGGGLLILLGIWSALKGAIHGYAAPETRSWRCRIRPLGLVIQILREPVRADLDASGGINGLEVLWLGLALSLDACGAGFCASLGTDFSFFLPPMAGLANWLFLQAGIFLGGVLGRGELPGAAVLPGLALVLLGVLRIV